MSTDEFVWNAFERKGNYKPVLGLTESGASVLHRDWESAMQGPNELIADELVTELDMSSVVKKRKRAMKHHKHRKLLKKTRHLRRKLGK